MRKLLGLLGIVAVATSCVVMPKVYRSPFYIMNKREPVYVEKSDTSLIYSDAQLETTGNILTALPDKKIKKVYAIDSFIFDQLKKLKYKPEFVNRGWRDAERGLVLTYKDYWINEQEPSFYRFWLKGISLKDTTNVIVYEGAPLQTTSSKIDPKKEVSIAIGELTIPGEERFVDESDVYTVDEEVLLPRAKYYGAISIGVAKRFGTSYSNLNPSEESHRKKLNDGMFVSGDLAYFFMPNFGAGLTVSSFKSKTIKDSINYEFKVNTKYLSDQVNILYAGPSLYARNLFFKGRLSTLVSVSGGYLGYKNNQIFTDKSFANTMKANGFGGKVGIGIDYLFHKNAGIGLNAGLLLGSLSVKNEMESADSNVEKLSMNQLNVGIGLRIFL